MSFHDYYEELVNLRVDGMLTPAEEAELDAHLAECPECRERLEIYQSIHQLSEDLLEEPPEIFTDGVMYKVGLEKKRRPLKKYSLQTILLPLQEPPLPLRFFSMPAH